MLKSLLSVLLASAVILPSASAIAADLDTLPPPPVTELRPAAYDWSGAYVGAFVGTACIDGILTENLTGTRYLNAGCGFKGGGLIGYNLQVSDIVYGVEGSIETTTNLVYNPTIAPPPGTADFKFGMDYIGRLNARIGWAMDDNLIYVMGGGAFGQGHLIDNVSTAPNDITAQHWGWSVGAGWEHAFTDQFHLRMDYMYTNFGNANYTAACCNITGGPGNEHEVRVGLIWAF